MKWLVTLHIYRGPVVQSSISANPGLNINTLFWFVYFYMAMCVKTLDKKTTVDHKRFLGKHIQVFERAVGKFDLKIYVNPGLS